MTSVKALEILKRDINEIKQFDRMYIELGGNDCNYDWDQISDNPYSKHEPVTTIEVYKETLSEIIDFARLYEITPILVSLPPLDYNQFYDFIVKNRNESNIMSFLGTKDQIYKHQKSYSDVVLSIAKEKKVDYMPLREIFLSRSDFSKILYVDGMHLTEGGQGIIYDSFLKLM